MIKPDMSQEEVEKRFNDFYKTDSIISDYFTDGERVLLTDKFLTEFGPLLDDEERNANMAMYLFLSKNDDYSSTSKTSGFYYSETLKKIFSGFEKNVKAAMLKGLLPLLNELDKEDKFNKEEELNNLRAEKEKQIKELEEKIESMQKSNESSSTFGMLSDDVEVDDDYFSANRVSSQKFELVENNPSLDLPLNSPIL